MHWIYLRHKFHNLSWITEINELFHNILIYWDAPVCNLYIYCICFSTIYQNNPNFLFSFKFIYLFTLWNSLCLLSPFRDTINSSRKPLCQCIFYFLKKCTWCLPLQKLQLLFFVSFLRRKIVSPIVWKSDSRSVLNRKHDVCSTVAI